VFGDPLVGRAGEDQSGDVSFGTQEGSQACAGTITIGQDEPVTWGFFIGPGFGRPGDDDGLLGENTVGRG
jgi:hypothetical protein